LQGLPRLGTGSPGSWIPGRPAHWPGLPHARQRHAAARGRDAPVTSRMESAQWTIQPGEPGFRCPAPSWAWLWVIRVSGPQHRPGCDDLPNFVQHSAGLFPSSWAIRVVYRRFWPTITRGRCYRGRFVLFCGGGI